ncbi:MAG TPA: carbohydrate-binding family 9-like protein [Pirellulales bacterium]|jgi:hypothetical protein|nr:carbohydrate-binding family 9-like protein [Pirellulales bacterium]
MWKHAKFVMGILASVLLFAATAFAAEPTAKPPSPAGQWDAMRSIVPQQYLCHFTREPIAVDGRAREAAWRSAPWTADFVDIEASARPRPRFRTRAKMLWDEKCFYVYAELDEPHVWATITKRNDVMFQDNDFEVFIDPEGTNHHYHEFEINALGTIWELSLDKPYRDGGPIHNPDNLPGLRSAVHVRGTLNNPSDTDQGWSVEIAFPWAELKKFAPHAASPPREGDTWRVDFSRVEWMADIIDGTYRKVPKRAEDNWVWSPPGIINMHAPERWGRVQFTRLPPRQGTFQPDPTAAARDLLMEVYYRQHVFHDQHKRYAATLAELRYSPANEPGIAAGSLRIEPSASGFVATVAAKLPDSSTVTLHMRDDSLLWSDTAASSNGAVHR